MPVQDHDTSWAAETRYRTASTIYQRIVGYDMRSELDGATSAVATR